MKSQKDVPQPKGPILKYLGKFLALLGVVLGVIQWPSGCGHQHNCRVRIDQTGGSRNDSPGPGRTHHQHRFEYLKTAGIKQTAYSASKLALIGLTQSSAFDPAPYGINVNAVCPGPTNNPLTPIALTIGSARRSSKRASPWKSFAPP
jgi:NAD(P)-dependent dehydrogenase (short-subunit alcohol dehydrogenase family)